MFKTPLSGFIVPPWLANELPSSKNVPLLTTNLQKFIHSLPFFIFLIISGFLLHLSVFCCLVSFILDGPIRPQWSIYTHVMHALLKTSMVICAPQGRHSMKLVRFITRFYLPSWFFSKLSFMDHEFVIHGYPHLSEKVNKIMVRFDFVCSN